LPGCWAAVGAAESSAKATVVNPANRWFERMRECSKVRRGIPRAKLFRLTCEGGNVGERGAKYR
jgi:hypothetical protein